MGQVPQAGTRPSAFRRLGPAPIDPATKYCQGAPSISAFFAEMGGNTMSLFYCRINKTHPSNGRSGGRSFDGCRIYRLSVMLAGQNIQQFQRSLALRFPARQQQELKQID
jgi:hypothetical protein